MINALDAFRAGPHAGPAQVFTLLADGELSPPDRRARPTRSP
ncbi:hypothetical protein [Streptomyces sp. Wb2n-11]|nr:hypothetical protein [Streptomyces sp. Wb2n-11]